MHACTHRIAGIAAPKKRKAPAYCGIQGGISHVYHPCTHGAMYKSPCTSRGSHVGEVNGEGITVGDGLLSQYVNRVIRRFHTAGPGFTNTGSSRLYFVLYVLL